MKNREYRIKIHSIFRFFIAFIIFFFVLVDLIVDNLPQPDSDIISFLMIIAVFVIAFYLAHLLGMGKVKVVFTQEGILHIWERRFFLSWEKNYIIP